MNTIIILLGTNVGDKKNNLENAICQLHNKLGKEFLRSKIYCTKAWGNTNQSDFYNQVVVLNTEKNVFESLKIIQQIENEMGRVRIEKWEPRIIDIDILFFNNEIIETENLQVPHPFLHKRRFTLIPLVEIFPTLIHPIYNKTISELLAECEDKLEVTELHF
jgi:2-amino-4-hydroxy-6-hydroxymethyldihydropteridine diphosphokinase